MSGDEKDEDLPGPDVAIPLLPGGVGATNAPPIPPVQPIADDEEQEKSDE
jgi:hypothetical protein